MSDQDDHLPVTGGGETEPPTNVPAARPAIESIVAPAVLGMPAVTQTPSEAAANFDSDTARRRVLKKQKAESDPNKPQDNKVLRLLEKNPLGMTLPEMAGGPRQMKKIKLLRPQLADAIKSGLVMPVSQRAGNTVYRLVKNLGPR